MENDVIEQIQKRMAELPEDVRSAIQSAHLGEHLQSIGQKRSLHIDQVGELEDEVLLVMLGFSHHNEFEKRLESTLKVSPELAKSLAEDVSNEVFMPIRESMRKFQEARNAPPAPAVPTAPAAVAQTPAVPPAPEVTPTVPAPKAPLSSTLPITPPVTIMPAITPTQAPAPVPTSAPQPTPQATPPAPAPKPVELHPVDVMLNEKTVSVAPETAPPAANEKPVYKADPYREPV